MAQIIERCRGLLIMNHLLHSDSRIIVCRPTLVRRSFPLLSHAAIVQRLRPPSRFAASSIDKRGFAQGPVVVLVAAPATEPMQAFGDVHRHVVAKWPALALQYSLLPVNLMSSKQISLD